MIADAWAWHQAHPEGYGELTLPAYTRSMISRMTAMTSATMAMVRVFMERSSLVCRPFKAYSRRAA